MKKSVIQILTSTFIMLVVLSSGCIAQEKNHEGEEDGTQYTKTQVYDEVKKGVRKGQSGNDQRSAWSGRGGLT